MSLRHPSCRIRVKWCRRSTLYVDQASYPTSRDLAFDLPHVPRNVSQMRRQRIRIEAAYELLHNPRPMRRRYFSEE